MRSLVTGVALVASTVLTLPAPAAGERTADAAPRLEAREVQTVWTGDFGLARPAGIAYVPALAEFVVAGSGGAATRMLRLGFDEDPQGTLQLPRVSRPGTVAFDAVHDRLTAIDQGALVTVARRDLAAGRPDVTRLDVSAAALGDPQAGAFDPVTGTWYVLDAAAEAIVVVPSAGSGATREIPLSGLAGSPFRGLAVNPADGSLFVASPGDRVLYQLDRSGSVQRTYDLSSVDLTDPQAMTFAPSADPTDDPTTMNLYIADAGDASSLGGVTEVTLVQAAPLAAPVITASLVKAIDASKWSPASPDPSGIVYLPGAGRFEVCDSEVDEKTGAGYHGVNLWKLTPAGAATAGGNTRAYSSEPTGLGYDAGSNTLFISDDPKRRVWVVKPGPDHDFGTADDVVTSIDAGAFGSVDTEDPEYDPVTGHLFFLDGEETEIYNVNPGAGGVFGDGNDTATHFDVGNLGPTDFEGLSSDPSTGDLLLGANRTDQIFQITKTGSLVRVIDATGIAGLRHISGLGVGPSSDGSGRMDYWIADRGIDNGSNSSENDGMVFDIRIPSSGNSAPVVTNPGTQNDAVGDAVSLQIQASDPDAGDTIAGYGASGLPTGLSVNTTTGLISGTTTAAGTFSVTISATDNHGATGTTGFAWNVTSGSGNSAPVVTNPGTQNDTVGDAVSLQIQASDPDAGDTIAGYGASGLPTGLSVNTTTGLISGTTTAAGTFSVTISATDNHGATGSTGFTWNVTSGSGSVLTFGPVADTFVDATNPTRNYGGRVVIRVNDDPIKHGLLKFTVSGVGSATVSSATLRLFVTDRSPDGGSVYQVADDTWQERTVTWNDAPAAGSLVGSIGPVAVGTWVEVDLTSYVTGDGTYSIRIQSASTNGAAYSSKEATSGNGPQLVVTLAP